MTQEIYLYSLCDKCLNEGREQIVEPDEDFCPSYGCDIDHEKVVNVYQTTKSTLRELGL